MEEEEVVEMEDEEMVVNDMEVSGKSSKGSG